MVDLSFAKPIMLRTVGALNFHGIVISLFLVMISVTNVNAAGNAVILWEKPLEGYIGDVKVANNGNVVFFYKSDAMSPAADVVACNNHGDYFWNKRFIDKVREIAITPSGDQIAVVSLQPKQIGNKHVVLYIEKGKEIWRLPGGERATFSPLENYILSFSDGKAGTGVFLYDFKGKPVWYSEKITLTDGCPDNLGQKIYGIDSDGVVFINPSNNQIQTYRIEKQIICHAFDPQNKFIFIADAEQLLCYDSPIGVKWSFKTDGPVYKIIPDPMRQIVTAYTKGKAYVIPYNRAQRLYNLMIPEEQIICDLRLEKEMYCFSENRNYLVAYKNKHLILYGVGEN